LKSLRPAGCARSSTSRGARNIAERYVECLARLAFVAPAIVEAICERPQPAEPNAEMLLKRMDLPLEWLAQLKALGVN